MRLPRLSFIVSIILLFVPSLFASNRHMESMQINKDNPNFAQAVVDAQAISNLHPQAPIPVAVPKTVIQYKYIPVLVPMFGAQIEQAPKATVHAVHPHKVVAKRKPQYCVVPKPISVPF